MAVKHGEVEEVAKEMEVTGDQDRVISTSHRRNTNGAKVDSKLRVLSSIELLIVVNFVLFTTVGSPLLEALLVPDGANYGLVPLNVGHPVLEALIEEDKRVTRGSIKKHSPCEDFSQSSVISRHGIEV